jgi:hypothetical protein
MSEKESFALGRKWTVTYFVTLAVLAVAGYWSGTRFEQFSFNPITAQSLLSILLPLLVIAVFVERAQEVFVSSWRELKRHELDHAQQVAFAERAAVKGSDPAKIAAAEKKLADANWELEKYKAQTRKHAFLLSLCSGVIISAAGVRILKPLMSWDIEYTGAQKLVFNFVDIFLTGGLIGGGSDGIHQMMNLLINRTKAANAAAEVQLDQYKRKLAGVQASDTSQ